MNILFINRSFFQYDKMIEEYIRKKGHKVYSYTTLPSIKYVGRLVFWKAMIKKRYLCRKNIVFALSIAQQYDMIKSLKRNHIDINAVFVLSGQTVRAEILANLKEMYPKAIFLWYLWDNIHFIDEYDHNKQFFDKLISFDFVDAQKEKIKFLPTFYISREIPTRKKYLICHVGSAHKERVKILAEYKKKIDCSNWFIYLYASKEEIIRNRNIPEWNEMRQYIHSRKLEYKEVIRILAESFATIDIPYNYQTGLTLRTYEALGLNTKIITNNKNVKKYDFYRENNIFVFDDNEEVPPESFWNEPFEKLPMSIYSKYSLGTWIDSLLKELGG